MAEYFPGISPDFSSLAEKPKSSPEKKNDDDDDDDFETAKKPEKVNNIFEKVDNDKQPEKPKKPEIEIPLESLADDEKQMVVSARKQEVGAELASAAPSSTHEQEALVAATFLEVLEDEVADDQTIEQALDKSEETALNIAGIEATELSVEPDEGVDAEDEAPQTQADSGGSPPPPPLIPPSSPNSAPTPPLVPTNPTAPAASPPSPPNFTNGTHNLYGNVPPPSPNIFSGNVPNTAPNNPPESGSERRSVAGPLLVGGIIGYMIGRRGGRIRTEKKLLPVQRKLESEVTDLQQKIALREEKIRKIVRGQMAKEPETPQKIAERMQALHEIKQDKQQKAAERDAEKAQKKNSEKDFDQNQDQNQDKNPERAANNILAERPERLGMLAMAAERATAPEKLKDTAQMTKRELLEIARHINIEQSNVKTLFESGRLDEDGLRRVVKAYLRGEKLERTFQENLKHVEEISIETLNNQNDQSNNAPPAYSGSTNSADLVATFKNADSVSPQLQDNATPTYYSNNPGTEVSKNSKKQPVQTVVVVVAITIAAAILIWILA